MSGTTAFDFSAAMARLCADVVVRVEEFNHIRLEQVAVTFAQARRRVPHGLQAKLTPLRFEGGSMVMRRRGRSWTIPRLYDGDRELLYILTFYLPRFLDHSFREKLITVFHELYHIGPEFDGDIRRHEGRYHVHSHSQKEYDEEMGRFVDRYLAGRPSPAVCGFLMKDFRGLQQQYGAVVGRQMPIPRLIPLAEPASA